MDEVVSDLDCYKLHTPCTSLCTCYPASMHYQTLAYFHVQTKLHALKQSLRNRLFRRVFCWPSTSLFGLTKLDSVLSSCSHNMVLTIHRFTDNVGQALDPPSYCHWHENATIRRDRKRQKVGRACGCRSGPCSLYASIELPEWSPL